MVLQLNTHGAGRFAPPFQGVKMVATDIQGAPESHSFVGMLAAFRPTGGTARGDDLARLLAEHQRGDFVSLARCMASGEIFSFCWRGCTWIPMFQFDLKDLSIRFRPLQIREELPGFYSGWEQAAWFARGHYLLDGRSPVDLLDSDFSRVIEAARCETA